MPKIPVYEAQYGLPAPGISVDRSGAMLAQAGNALAAQLEQMHARAERARQQDEALWVAKTAAEARVEWTRRRVEREQQAPAGAPDFTPTLLRDYGEYTQQTLEAAPSADARARLELDLIELGGSLQANALAFEAKSRVRKRQADINDIVEMNANSLMAGADDFDLVLARTAEAIAAQDLPDDLARDEVDRARERLGIAAVNGLIGRDARGGLAALSAGDWDAALSPESKATLINRAQVTVRQIETEERQRMAIARADLRDQLRDVEASLLDGRATDYDPGRIRAVLGDEEGGRTLAALEDAASLGRDRAAIRFATPAELAEIVAERTEALDDPDASGYRGRAAAADTILREAAERNRALGQDPAAFVRQAPAVLDAWEAMEAAPAGEKVAATNAYVRATLALQEELGVPASGRRVMPKAEAELLVAEMGAAAPEDRADALEQTAQRYGDYWPRIYRELTEAGLSAEYQALATTDHPSARKSLAEALALPMEDLRRSVGVNAKPIDDAVTAALESFQRSLALAPNGAAMAVTYEDAARRLAYRYGQLNEPAAAAQQAVEELITARYDFVEQDGAVARTPKGLGDQAEDYGDWLLMNLSPQDLHDPGGNKSLLAGDRREIALSAAQRGVWVTTENDDGWVLLDVNRQPVKRADGSRIEFRFSQVTDVPNLRGRVVSDEEIEAMARRSGLTEEQVRRNLERRRHAEEEE